MMDNKLIPPNFVGYMDCQSCWSCCQSWHTLRLKVCACSLKSFIIAHLPSLARNSVLNISAKDAPQSPVPLDGLIKSFSCPVQEVEC